MIVNKANKIAKRWMIAGAIAGLAMLCAYGVTHPQMFWSQSTFAEDQSQDASQNSTTTTQTTPTKTTHISGSEANAAETSATSTDRDKSVATTSSAPGALFLSQNSPVVLSLTNSVNSADPSASAAPLTLESKAVFLYALNSQNVSGDALLADGAEGTKASDGLVVYADHPDEELAVASLTKLMTALVVFDSSPDLDQSVTITAEMLKNVPSEFSVVGLKAGDVATIRDLLYALILPSAADAAEALAVTIAGSTDAFVAQMNAKATELKLEHTHFSNTFGGDDNNYSSARDIATILRNDLQYSDFKTIFAADSYNFTPLNKTIKKTVATTATKSSLDVSALTGSKTGFTFASGRCLASTATVDGVDYLLVTLGASSSTAHITDSTALYAAFGQNYSFQKLFSAGDTLLTLPIDGAWESEYSVAAPADLYAYTSKNSGDNSTEFSFVPSSALESADTLTSASLPLTAASQKIAHRTPEGAELGTLKITQGGQTVYSTSVKLDRALNYHNYLLYIILAIIAVIVIFFLLRTLHFHRRRARRFSRRPQ